MSLVLLVREYSINREDRRLDIVFGAKDECIRLSKRVCDWKYVFERKRVDLTINLNSQKVLISVGRVFANGPGDTGFSPRSSHTEDLKNCT